MKQSQPASGNFPSQPSDELRLSVVTIRSLLQRLQPERSSLTLSLSPLGTAQIHPHNFEIFDQDVHIPVDIHPFSKSEPLFTFNLKLTNFRLRDGRITARLGIEGASTGKWQAGLIAVLLRWLPKHSIVSHTGDDNTIAVPVELLEARLGLQQLGLKIVGLEVSSGIRIQFQNQTADPPEGLP